MTSVLMSDSRWAPGGLADERPSHNWKLEVFSPALPHSLEEEGLKMELIINHADLMKPP